MSNEELDNAYDEFMARVVKQRADDEAEAAKWHAECVAQEDSKDIVKTVYRTEYTMVTNEPKHFTEEEIFELFMKFTARLKEETD